MTLKPGEKGLWLETVTMVYLEFPEVLVLAHQIQLFFDMQPRGRHPGMREHLLGPTPSLAHSGGSLIHRSLDICPVLSLL